MTVNDRASQERYVALQAWLCGQMSPRAPHAADLFAQDRECLYAAFLSVLVGTRLGFADYDDNQAHHGLYAFDFFVGDLEAPSCRAGVDGARGSGVAGESAAAAAAPAMCHAIVDTWLGDTSARIPFVASVIASVATLELVADVRVDECVFECELPREYARFTANMPFEDGSLPIGSLDLSLVAPGPLIHLEARPRYKGQALSPRALPRPWHRPCRWGSPWSRPLRSPSGPPPLCAPRTIGPRCSGGPPTRWLARCPRAGTPGECGFERASLTRRRSNRPPRRRA